jgi:2-haloacid dehalogenase
MAVEGARPRALTFDVFGTVVDWRGSLIRELTQLNLDCDPAEFADAWRGGYGPAMRRVASGELPWTNIDALHRMILDELLGRFAVTGLSEAAIENLNRTWHRLTPWPDAIAGLTRLREQHVLATLSNGNVALLTNMAKHAGLPWDCILSAELVQRYKPDAVVYQMAAGYLGFTPAQVMMVAAHPKDLRAAAAAGLATAFVARPDEHGPGGDVESGEEFDLRATGFNDLADQLAPPDPE